MINLFAVAKAAVRVSGHLKRRTLLQVLVVPGVLISASAVLMSNEAMAVSAARGLRVSKPIQEPDDTITGQYILSFGRRDPGVPSLIAQDVEIAIERRDLVESQLEGLGAEVRFRYDATGVGFSAVLPPIALAKARELENKSNGLIRLEPNRIMTLFGRRRPADGVDRIDQLSPPPDGSYTPMGDGSGVHVYVIDSGILASHDQFGGRVLASLGFEGIDDGFKTSDCEGHGTHVAGIIGGSEHGVARNVSLHPVRVFGCSGRTVTDVVKAGVEWVTVHHKNNPGPAVANMSLGGAHSDALEEAILKSMRTKITYVFAAGNNYAADSCKISPAGLRPGITVASINPNNDYRDPTSNTGLCVDIFASGENIWSTDCLRSNAVLRRSGTSMAAPHVAGIAAIILQRLPDAQPYQVWNAIEAAATKGTADREIVHNRGDSPDVLLFWGDRRDRDLRAAGSRSIASLPNDIQDLAVVSWINERCLRP